MTSLLLYLSMIILGVIIGSRKTVKARKLLWLGQAQTVALILLIFTLGVEIGSNEQVISSLGEIGLSAFIITAFALAGSVGCVLLVRHALHLDRQGRKKSTQQEAHHD